MPAPSDWNVPPDVEPRTADFDFDLEGALRAIVGIRASVPDDAFTADVLGTERSGHGVVIDKAGVILTIGYLITEAETVWLTTAEDRLVPATPIGYDQETGFGLVQALGRLDLPTLPLGNSADAELGSRAVIAGAGGRRHSVASRIVARQEFAGYWEYLLDDALYVAPAHPYWGGTGLIGPGGSLLGIGSLQLQQTRRDGEAMPLNMVVPIDLLKPILNDILTIGRPNRPARPWLGLYSTEVDERVVVAGVADKGPADRAGIETGDIILAVAGSPVESLAGLYRAVWSLGDAGVGVPMTLLRESRTLELTVASGDRNRFLKQPKLH